MKDVAEEICHSLVVYKTWPNLCAQHGRGQLEKSVWGCNSKSHGTSYLAIIVNLVEPELNRVGSNAVHNAICFPVGLAIEMGHGYNLISQETLWSGLEHIPI